MKIEIIDVLSKVFLFNSIPRDTLTRIIGEIAPEIAEFHHRDVIYSPRDYQKKIGFIASGECKVERVKTDGKSVPLNLLKAYDSFGVMAVLSDEEDFPTQITAVKDSAVIFITKDKLLSVLKKYPDVSMNLIYFLSEKISFLNKKISTFTSDTAEDKLANLLLQEYRSSKNFEIPFNCQKMAKMMNMGRASLYRAIANLTDSNTIKLENKKIYILNPKGLERN